MSTPPNPQDRPSHLADWVPPAWSRYFHRTLESWQLRGLEPDQTLQAWFNEAVSAEKIDQAIAAGYTGDDELSLANHLRQVRQSVMLTLIARDLNGLADLHEVVSAVTALAQSSVSAALAFATRSVQATYGTPRDAQGAAQDLLVVGMGKLGGEELNVSSDIDLVFVYPEDGVSDGSRSLANMEFFARVARKVLSLIGEISAAGMVFRVDTRLRPNGDAGPLVVSFGMLEEYLMVQGREWERYAWLKGRVVSAPVLMPPEAFQAALRGLNEIVRPFVFRRYLDFGAIRALRGLHAQIRAEAGRRDAKVLRRTEAQVEAIDVKLGRGGIREIEFIAQVFQIIRGGREANLQVKSTRKALSLLAQTGRISPQDEQILQASYDFLRRVEHRLQYREDAQTHHLPATEVAQTEVAAAMGYDSLAAFLARLADINEQVSERFDHVFGDKVEDSAPSDDPYLGFRDPTAARVRVEATCNTPRILALPQAHRERFERVLNRIVAASATHQDKDMDCLSRLLGLLEAIARRGAYLSLFDEYPATLERVATMVASSPWAAQYLTQNPLVLDELLDDRELHLKTDWPQFELELDQLLQRATITDRDGHTQADVERQMDILREQHHAQVFRILAQDLAGLWTVEHQADALSALADVMIRCALKHSWLTVPKRHRDTPALAIIAYGKLGGKELGFASDLDLVFLYDDPDPDAADVYVRLTRRLTTWLTAMTSAGGLFEIDLRLRPNGDAGLVVTDLAGFERYQRESAWVWEHQALTRARFCAGDASLAAQFDRIRSEVLQQARELTSLRQEVCAMRQKMLDGHRNPTPLFDLKHDRGGMVDIEFMVQYLVLGFSSAHPSLVGNIGNIALLRQAAELGLLSETHARELAQAYRVYRRRQHAERLLGATRPRVAPDELQHERAAVQAAWLELMSIT